MIEAVNSVISNSSALRAGAVQQQSFSANVDAVESVSNGTAAPFIVAFDTDFDRAILQVEDTATGDVLRQIPTERTLELRQVIAAREAVEVDVVIEPAQIAPDQVAPQEGAGNAQSAVSFETSTIVTAQSSSAENPTSTVAAAQTAVAALSAGAQSGQGSVSQVDVTA